uniref:Leucine-rich repeat-containing N-terminal plant-type domain-containing protein n=1 Tax=Aegilops tauschii subsp. strangulata TaxID=200361 RepID=A0A453T0X0_AEGTS
VHISPRSLPKGLHSLDLSRNKITNVEGLWELTKLRVLNLSYNRISRIGHGKSQTWGSCIALDIFCNFLSTRFLSGPCTPASYPRQ